MSTTQSIATATARLAETETALEARDLDAAYPAYLLAADGFSKEARARMLDKSEFAAIGRQAARLSAAYSEVVSQRQDEHSAEMAEFGRQISALRSEVERLRGLVSEAVSA